MRERWGGCVPACKYWEPIDTFARRVAGKGYPFDEKAHRALVLEEVGRAYDPGGIGRQIAAIAVTGDRRSRLARITTPTLVVHGADDPLILPACGEDTAASIPHRMRNSC